MSWISWISWISGTSLDLQSPEITPKNKTSGNTVYSVRCNDRLLRVLRVIQHCSSYVALSVRMIGVTAL
jgi:hypothetical protein